MVESKDIGSVVLTIEEYRKKRGISKNKIVLGANMQRTQLQKYCNNSVARIELNVMARLCDFFQCDISDLMRYEPADKDKNT